MNLKIVCQYSSVKQIDRMDLFFLIVHFIILMSWHRKYILNIMKFVQVVFQFVLSGEEAST